MIPAAPSKYCDPFYQAQIRKTEGENIPEIDRESAGQWLGPDYSSLVSSDSRLHLHAEREGARPNLLRWLVSAFHRSVHYPHIQCPSRRRRRQARATGPAGVCTASVMSTSERVFLCDVKARKRFVFNVESEVPTVYMNDDR